MGFPDVFLVIRLRLCPVQCIVLEGTVGEIELNAKSPLSSQKSSPQSNRGRKHYDYQPSIKPECDGHHRAEIAKTQGDLTLSYSQADALRHPHFEDKKITASQVEDLRTHTVHPEFTG